MGWVERSPATMIILAIISIKMRWSTCVWLMSWFTPSSRMLPLSLRIHPACRGWPPRWSMAVSALITVSTWAYRTYGSRCSKTSRTKSGIWASCFMSLLRIGLRSGRLIMSRVTIRRWLAIRRSSSGYLTTRCMTLWSEAVRVWWSTGALLYIR